MEKGVCYVRWFGAEVLCVKKANAMYGWGHRKKKELVCSRYRHLAML